MDQIAFLLSEATFLRYFMPIAIEAQKRSIVTHFFVEANNKYNNPKSTEAFRQISELAERHEIILHEMSELSAYKGIVFIIEGVGIDHTTADHEVYSITYMTDFALKWDHYIDRVKGVIMPSKFFAHHHGRISDKNLFLGSPKYDVELDGASIKKRYDLDDTKKALIIFPRRRDMKTIDLNRIYQDLRNAGYQLLVKTRGKDPVGQSLQGDRYFQDESWFPHTTMELITISDIVINFGSTAIKECVMLRTPIINFKVKPFAQPLGFLYNGDYCVQMAPGATDMLDVVSALTRE